MIGSEQITALDGATVVGPDGHKIGTVDELMLGDEGGRPEWALLALGIVAGSAYVPLAQADIDPDGRVSVPFDRDTVRAAPDVATRTGRLSDEDADKLSAYYGVDTTSLGEADAADAAGYQDIGQQTGVAVAGGNTVIGGSTAAGYVDVRKDPAAGDPEPIS